MGACGGAATGSGTCYLTIQETSGSAAALAGRRSGRVLEGSEGTMAYEIRRVAVLGANGTMGALSGGIFAQCGVHVCFVARSRDKAVAGIEKAVAQARSEQLARF